MHQILLDTHVLLWWLAEDQRLSDRARREIENPENLILASAVCAWEISIKKALGKLTCPDDLLAVVRESALMWVPIEPEEAFTAGELAPHHRDPFDRLLVAQAHRRKAKILSRDPMLDRYRVDRIW